jgi:hypothetical protein
MVISIYSWIKHGEFRFHETCSYGNVNVGADCDGDYYDTIDCPNTCNPGNVTVGADCDGDNYDTWPDMVVWSDTTKYVLLIELTVPLEENMEGACERKTCALNVNSGAGIALYCQSKSGAVGSSDAP